MNKKLHPQGGGVFGHGEWGIGHGEEVTCLAHALCPKRRGGYPSPPTLAFAQRLVEKRDEVRGWSFPPLSMNSYLLCLYTFASDKKDVLYLPDVSRTIAECIAVNRRTI